jgi:hypothetical protein
MLWNELPWKGNESSFTEPVVEEFGPDVLVWFGCRNARAAGSLLKDVGFAGHLCRRELSNGLSVS